MGLPIAQLVVATNRNDILARFFASGTYRAGEVTPTMSPSMDIQVASNFERLLFDLCEGDGAAVARLLGEFAARRSLRVPDDALGRARELFDAARVDEDETATTMAEVLRASGAAGGPAHRGRHPRRARLPARSEHAAGQRWPRPIRPSFRTRCDRATGIRPPLPERLADLFDRPERCAVLPNDLAAVQRHIQELVMETA